MKIYKKYDKIEKPLVELAKQIKKSTAKDENIKRGIKLILSDEAAEVIRYLDNALSIDNDYPLPAMRADTTPNKSVEPDMSEVENKISDMEECTNLINMIMSMLPPGVLITASQAEHYSIMGEILEAYRAKDFMRVKDIIVSNWRTEPDNQDKEETAECKSETDEKVEAADIADGYLIDELYGKNDNEIRNKFVKLINKDSRTSTEESLCYVIAAYATGVLKPTMTIKEVDNLIENENIAIEQIKLFLDCMNLTNVNEPLLKATLNENALRVRRNAQIGITKQKIEKLHKYYDSCGDVLKGTEIRRLIKLAVEILEIPKVLKPEQVDDAVDMVKSLFENEGIFIDSHCIETDMNQKVANEE